jgi:hypothetical protein
MEIASFNSRVIVYFAGTVLWRFAAVWTETFLHTLPRNRRDSVCNALLLQSYSLLWKRVPTIRRPAVAPSGLPRQRAQQSPAQQMGRLQLSGVMSQYKEFTKLWLRFASLIVYFVCCTMHLTLFRYVRTIFVFSEFLCVTSHHRAQWWSCNTKDLYTGYTLFESWLADSQRDHHCFTLCLWIFIFSQFMLTFPVNLTIQSLSLNDSQRITDFVKKSSFSEADILSIRQEISLLLWRPKFYRRVWESQPLIQILSQLTAAHIPNPHFFNIYLILSHLCVFLWRNLFSSHFANLSISYIPFQQEKINIFCIRSQLAISKKISLTVNMNLGTWGFL